MEEIKTNEKLFKDVKFYVIEPINSQVEQTLLQGGAKRDNYLGERVTHVIAEDTNELDYSEAREVFDLPVVTGQWVLQSVQCGQLLPTDAFSPASNQLFSGVVACASNVSAEDAKVLWALITYNGGRTQSRLDKHVTHLICPDESGVKYAAATSTGHSDHLHVVSPDWVTDSVREKIQQPVDTYHPRFLITDDVPAAKENTIADKAQQQLQVTDEPPEQEERPKVVLAPLSHASKATVRASAIVPLALLPTLPQEDESSFELAPEPPPAAADDMSELEQSSEALESMSDFSSMQADDGADSTVVPAKKKQRARSASTSQRNSKNRELKLAKGQKSRTKSTAKINQLVAGDGSTPVTPQPFSMPWPTGSLLDTTTPPSYVGHDPLDRVPMEVCLLSCVFYITDYQKYVDAAQLDVWKKVIVQHGGQVDESYSNRVTHVLCENQNSDVFHLALRDGKRLVTAHWLNDCLLQQSLTPPWTTLHLPARYSGLEHPYGNQVICLTNFEGEERTRVKFMIAGIGAKYTGYLSKLNSILIAKSPTGLKYSKAVEWQMPVANVTWLSDLLLGETAALRLPLQERYTTFDPNTDPFKLDTQRSAFFLMNGWRLPVKVSKEAWKRYASGMYGSSLPLSLPGPSHDTLKRPLDSPQDSATKKARLDERRESLNRNAMEMEMHDLTPVVLVTGLAHTEAARLAELVAKLGGRMATSPQSCSHLVAPAVIRTVKFLAAFSVAKHVVRAEWIEKSVQHGQFLDETDFLLSDDKAERDYNFNLQESHKRARERPLFEGMTFYITPSVVVPDKATLRALVESAGGSLVSKRLSARTIASSALPNGKAAFIVITCADDLPLLPDLAAKSIGLQSAEFIVSGIIKQQLDYESFLVSES